MFWAILFVALWVPLVGIPVLVMLIRKSRTSSHVRSEEER